MHDATEGGRKARLGRGRWVSVMAVALITLALLEVSLRLFGLTRPVLYESDALAGFRLKPNQSVAYLGNTIPINKWGLRDPRALDAPAQGTRRILVLGDSVTWGGIRMPQDALFTTLLENQLPGRQVVNGGVNGYSVAQMAALYKAHLKELAPDTIMLYVIPSDFLRPPSVRLTGDSLAYPLKRPKLALPVAISMMRLFAHHRWGWDWLATPAAAVAREEAPEEACVAQNLRAIVELASGLEPGQDLIVVVSPGLRHAANVPLPAAVAPALAGLGIRLVDLGDAGTPEKAWFVDHIHLSEEGHRWVAKQLAGVLGAQARMSKEAEG